jgi:hypothetical protein
MVIGTLYTFIQYLGNGEPEELTYASTIAFTTFVMFQVYLIFF